MTKGWSLQTLLLFSLLHVQTLRANTCQQIFESNSAVKQTVEHIKKGDLNPLFSGTAKRVTTVVEKLFSLDPSLLDQSKIDLQKLLGLKLVLETLWEEYPDQYDQAGPIYKNEFAQGEFRPRPEQIMTVILLTKYRSGAVSAQEALDLYRGLKSHGFIFQLSPYNWHTKGIHLVNSAGWFLARMLDVAAKKSYASPESLVQDQNLILDQFMQDLADLRIDWRKFMEILGEIGGHAQSKGLSIESTALLKSRLREAIDPHLPKGTAREIAISNGIPESDLKLMENHSAGAMTAREFFARLDSNPASVKGGLFGIDDPATEGIASLTGLSTYRSLYQAVWKSSYMEGLTEAQKRSKTASFVWRVVTFGYDIYFFVPKVLNRTEFTKYEYEYLLQNPRLMKRVHFIFGLD